MNINHHSYESFPERLRRLIEESGMNAKELGEKIGISKSAMSKYINQAREPDLETIIKIADCLNVTLDYLLCRKSAVLSLHNHKDNIFIHDKTEFDFNRLLAEYDDFLTALLGDHALSASSSDTVSIISLLHTINLRDTVAVYKSRHSLPAEEYPAFLIRSAEIHKIINHLSDRLTQGVISKCCPKTQLSAVDLNIKSSAANLLKMFSGRSSELYEVTLENLLITLEHLMSQHNHY